MALFPRPWLIHVADLHSQLTRRFSNSRSLPKTPILVRVRRHELKGPKVLETSGCAVANKLSREVDIEDLRRLAERRMPRIVFDYLDGGAEAEVTLKENSRAFETITFRPRQALPTADTDLRTSILGCELAFPLILGPIGYTRLIHASGELAVARAAGAAGVGYVVATFAGYRLEEVKAATSGPAWYQLYLVAGREAAEAAIERARLAGYSALVVTVDTPVAGLRERDVRNGMKELLAGSLLSKLPFLPQLLAHPQWLASFLMDGGLPKLENVILPGRGPMPLVGVSAGLARQS